MERAYLLLQSGGVLVLGADGVRGEELRLDPAPSCGLSSASGLVLGLGDGRLLMLRSDLSTVAAGRDPESRWAAVTQVHRAGVPLLAAVDIHGVVVLWTADRLVESGGFQTGTALPVAAIGEDEALIIASQRGLLRRFRLAEPQAWQAFLATTAPEYFTGLASTQGGGLVALTSTGRALWYDGRDPTVVPGSWQPAGRHLIQVASLGDERAVAADDAGGLWLMRPRARSCEELPRKVETKLVGLGRVGDHLVSVHAEGAVHFFPLGGDVEIGRSHRINVGVPLAGLVTGGV